VEWSADGRLVATAGGRDLTARVWDADTGKELVLQQQELDALVPGIPRLVM
jgi:WD40 repeat protein